MAKAKVEFEFVPLDDRLKKSLKENQDIAKQTEKDAQKAATSVGRLLSAATAGLANAKIIGFFKEAVASANRLEQSLARVESAARAFGQSTTKAKEAAQDLAKDGFLSLNQSASSLSNLMATGLNVEQSKKFITAAKDISAFGNTIGDAAESVESGIKGILTGSSELVENMSPKMKTLSMRFTENKNKVGEAKAAQILYNDVLKLGNQFTGDAAKYLDTAAAAEKRFQAATEKASAAIGQGLQPIFKKLYDSITPIIDAFTKWFSGLGEGTKAVILIGGALAAMVPIVGALIPLFAALTLATPFGWVSLAVVGLTALAAVLTEIQSKNAAENIVKQSKSAVKEVETLGARMDELSKINKRTAKEELELTQSKEALRKKAQELGVDYDKLAASARGYLAVTEEIANKERHAAAGKIKEQRDSAERLYEEVKKTQEVLDREREKQGGHLLPNLEATYKENEKELQRLNDKAANLALQEANIFRKDVEEKPGSKGSQSQVAANLNEIRFIESQQQIGAVRRDYTFTLQKIKNIKMTAAERKKAEEDAFIDQDRRIKDIGRANRQVYAQYIEDKTLQDQLALNAETSNVIAAVRERANARSISEKQADRELAKIRETQILKEKALRMQSLADTLGAANQIANGALQLQNAKGNVGGVLSGFGGITTGLSGLKGLLPSLGFLGPAGAALGAAGGLISTFSSLFGKSDEERAKEAANQARRDEEAKKLLEIQAEYQKRMLNIQEANAKLPFENLQRQLRLIDIKAQQAELAGASPEKAAKERLAARNAAIQGTINSQSGTIGQGELFKGFTPTAESLTNLLSTTAGQRPSTDAYLQYAAQALGDVGSIQQLAQLRQQMEALAGSVPKEIVDASLPTVRDKERNFWTLYNQMHAGDYGARSSKEQREKFLAEMLKADYATSGNVTKFSADVATRTSGSSVAARVGNLGAEFKNDVSVAENLISVIEQGNQTQLEIAKNTKETAQALTLEKDRSAAFIDIAGGGIRGFGQLLAGTYGLNSNALQIPKGLSNAMLASVGTKSLEQQGVEAMQKMLAVNMDMRELLAEIAINTNRGFGDVSGSLSESDLLTKLQSFKDRS